MSEEKKWKPCSYEEAMARLEELGLTIQDGIDDSSDPSWIRNWTWFKNNKGVVLATEKGWFIRREGGHE